MVDNRTSGYFGIGGAFNFKSGDISGTAAKTSDDRQSPGMEYFQQQHQEEQNEEKNPHVDRSAQLNATLSSLAMNNIATILRKHKKIDNLTEPKYEKIEIDEEISRVNSIKKKKK